MKYLLAMLATAASGLLVAVASTPASAHDVAARCNAYGCDHIVCNRTGDRCRRFSSYDERYARLDDYRYGDVNPYRDYADGVYPHFRVVCDNYGGRCYSSYGPYWDYREYYRRRGYRWAGNVHESSTYYDRRYNRSYFGGSYYADRNSGDGYYGSPYYDRDVRREYRETDQLNSDQYDAQRNDDDYGSPGADDPNTYGR